MKTILLLSFLFLAIPVFAGNPTGRKWEKKEIRYSVNDLPLPYDPSNLQLKGVPKLIPHTGEYPFCAGCILINYINEEGRVPARSFVISSKSIIRSCQIDIFNNYKNFASPEVAYKNFIDHEMIHCLGGGHTAAFTGFKFSPFHQPLMSSTGRTLSPGLSFDDKNLLWEIYNVNLKKKYNIQITTERLIDNVFVLNKITKKYSISKYGGANSTYFYNLYPGQYYIGVRLYRGASELSELKWVCESIGKGFSLCDAPVTIWIQRNKRILIK